MDSTCPTLGRAGRREAAPPGRGLRGDHWPNAGEALTPPLFSPAPPEPRPRTPWRVSPPSLPHAPQRLLQTFPCSTPHASSGASGQMPAPTAHREEEEPPARTSSSSRVVSPKSPSVCLRDQSSWPGLHFFCLPVSSRMLQHRKGRLSNLFFLTCFLLSASAMFNSSHNFMFSIFKPFSNDPFR